MNWAASLALLLLLPLAVAARDNPTASAPPEALVVTVQVKGVPATELTGLLAGDRFYVPLEDFFRYLRIRVDVDSSKQIYSGYYLTKDSSYTFDLSAKTIKVKNNSAALADSEYVVRDRIFYLHTGAFLRYFGLNIRFSANSVSIKVLKPPQNLPVYLIEGFERQSQRDLLARKGLQSVERNILAPSTLFEAGALDWTLAYDGISPLDRKYRFRFRTGLEVLWGDLNIQGAGRFGAKQRTEDYLGTMTYPILSPYLQQIIIGDMVSNAEFRNQIFGAEITNRPPSYPTLFTNSEPLHENFGPDRNVLLEERAKVYRLGSVGTSGEFQREIPLYYGQNQLNFKTYDYWGDVQEYRFLYDVPVGFLRPGDVQYSLMAGRARFHVIEPYYGLGKVAWGVNTQLTVGASVESYRATDVNERSLYPSLFAYSRLAKALILNTTVSPLLQSTATLDYELPSRAYLTLGLTEFKKDAPSNYRDASLQYIARMGLPFYGSRGGVDFAGQFLQTNLPNYFERTANFSVSGYFEAVQPEIAYTVGWNDYHPERVVNVSQSQWALRMHLPQDILFVNELFYDHLTRRLLEFDVLAGKAIGQALFTLTYRRLFETTNIFTFSLRYVFPFLQTTSTYNRVGGVSSFNEIVSGSVLMSTRTGDILFDHRLNRTRTGNMVMDIFEDKNNNGKRDKDEAVIPIGSIDVSSDNGRYAFDTRGKGEYEFRNLNPYAEYRIGINSAKIEDPLLVPSFSTFSYFSRPAKYVHVEIPLTVGGTVRGHVQEVHGETKLPIEGLTIIADPVDSAHAGQKQSVRSFSTGEFEITKLLPGNYRIHLDADELARLGMKGKVIEKQLEIRQLPEGDVIENVDFELTR